MKRETRGLSDMVTAQKSKLHSKPHMKGTKYLKLYTLAKEKERLEQYKAVIDKTQEQTEACLQDVQQQMEEIARSLPEGDTELDDRPAKRKTKKHMDKMVLHY